jgi:transcriptional antiterminator RfaH
MTNFKSGWYLLYTMPRNERKVAIQLADMKLRHYLPMLRALRNWCGKVKVSEVPLFPSYVFVYLEQLHDYFAGTGIRGAMNFVRVGKKMARVDDAVVNNLKSIVDMGKDVEVSSSEFKPGQKLTITEGPFAGIACEMIEHNGNKKIIVRISLLNRNVLISIPGTSVSDIIT